MQDVETEIEAAGPAELMRAAQVFGVGDVRCVSDVAIPKPGPEDALVETSMASICGSDLHMAGMGWQIPEYPAPAGHPGHEAVGVVVEPPSSYPEGCWGDPVESGDAVLAVPHIWDSMCFAKYMKVHANHLLKLPSSVPISHLLMTQQLGTVMFATRRLPESLDGKTCGVLGQGSAGLFWDFVLKRRGASRVIAIEPVGHRRELGLRYGADDLVAATGKDATDAVVDLTDGVGADIVIEAVGSTPTLSQAFHLVRDEGTCVLFGLPESNDPVPFDYTEMFKKRANAYSILGAQIEPGLKTFRAAMQLIAEGEIDMAHIVTHVFDVSRVPEAFELARRRDDGVVKIGLVF